MKLTEQDFERAAKKLKCEVASIKAVAEVESRGNGFYASGLNMFPQFTTHNVFNSSATNSKTLRQSQPFFTLFSQSTNFYHLVCGQLRPSIIFTIFIHYCQMMCLTFVGMPFRISVSIIVQMCAKKKMVWIATRRVVTRMANKQLVRINSVMQKICNAVCPPRIIAVPKFAVALRASPFQPFPTHISFLDVLMKTHFIFCR